jgi:hypothetical protein
MTKQQKYSLLYTNLECFFFINPFLILSPDTQQKAPVRRKASTGFMILLPEVVSSTPRPYPGPKYRI